MKDTLLKNIEKYIEPKTITLSFNDGEFKVTVTDYVAPGILAAAIENIETMVRINDYSYELFDILMGYYTVTLFTDIPVPQRKGEDGEMVDDYEKCFDICTRLNLTDMLACESDSIAYSLAFIEKNVWRRLEYCKTMESNSALMLLCDKAYEMLENLDGLMGKFDIDNLNKIADTLGDFTQNLSLVENPKDK